jgi:mono/diheme cytochrome c family protein
MERFGLVALVVAGTLTLVDGAVAQSASQVHTNAAFAPQGPASPAPVQPASATQGQTAPAPPSAAAAPAGNAETGRKLFVSIGCYQCHGYEAQGSTATGPRLGPRPISYAAFSRYVRQPVGQMPPYTTRIVADTDLAHIYAFLVALPEPPTVQSTPLLK